MTEKLFTGTLRINQPTEPVRFKPRHQTLTNVDLDHTREANKQSKQLHLRIAETPTYNPGIVDVPPIVTHSSPLPVHVVVYLDHARPRQIGGTNYPDLAVRSCACNGNKSSKCFEILLNFVVLLQTFLFGTCILGV